MWRVNEVDHEMKSCTLKFKRRRRSAEVQELACRWSELTNFGP